MNDNQERLLERMRLTEVAMSAVIELTRSTNMLVGSISTALSTIAGAQADIGRRLTDLEKKP